MNRSLKQSLAATLCFLMATATLVAQPHPRLKREAVVSGEIVRLDDLVEHAGALGQTALFAAPQLGGVGTIRAERIAEAARELGLAALEGALDGSIIVRRPATTLSAATLTALVATTLTQRDRQFADAPLAFDPPLAAIIGDTPETVAPRLVIEDLDLRSGRFVIRLVAGAVAHRLTGTADLRMDIPVLARPLGRGEAITAGDLASERKSRRDLPVGIVEDPVRLVGMVARRGLAAGQLLRQSDLAAPELVERNQPVTVSYTAPGINLTLRGRALAGGVLGAVVPVQNLTSKRTIDAVITGAGKVSARLDALQTKASN